MTRARCHKAVRDVKRNQAELLKTKLTDRAASGDNKYFWYEVKKLNGSKSTMPTQVDGFNEDIDIANCFADKYQNLFNSVKSDEELINQIWMTKITVSTTKHQVMSCSHLTTSLQLWAIWIPRNMMDVEGYIFWSLYVRIP